MRRYARARAVVMSLLIAMLLVPTFSSVAGPTPVEAQSGTDIVDKFGASQIISFTSQENQPNHGALAKDAGVRWTKEGFGWYIIERSQGAYSFGPQDNFVNNAVSANLNILGE